MSGEKIRNPTARDVELAAIQSSENKWKSVFEFGAVAVRSAAYCFALYVGFDGLKEIVLSKPENINALSSFINNFRLGEGVLTITAGVASIGWYRERKGKKRMTALKGKFQKQLEGQDPARTTSGLDSSGHNSPEDDQ